jgi:hypothetical protein
MHRRNREAARKANWRATHHRIILSRNCVSATTATLIGRNRSESSPSNVMGVASVGPPPPLPTPPRRGRRMPGGRVGNRRGRALKPVPRVRPPAGATDAGGCPIDQALPRGNATNFVPSLDFTLRSTVCLPSLRASLRCLRTSAGFATDLPPTSRITSPTWKP